MKALLALLLLLAADGSAQEIAPAGFSPRIGTRLPQLAFRDEHGALVSTADYFGRPFLLVFAYHSCPQLCGLVLNALVTGLRGVDSTVGKDFDVVVVSIDPHDTPERAAAAERRYVARYERNGGEGWHFLVGDAPAIRALAAAAGVRYFFDPVQEIYVHPAGVLKIDRGGIVRTYLEGANFTPLALKQLLAGDRLESSGWRRLCGALGLDPAPRTGAVLAALRIAVIALAALLAGVAVSWRRRGGSA